MQIVRCISALTTFSLLMITVFIAASDLLRERKTGVIAYVCDESRSMGAEDKNGVPRIERCKDAIGKLDKFPDTHIALYGFTDRAASHSSFSRDHTYFRKTVSNLVAIEAVPGSGSDIGFSLITVIEDVAEKREELGKKTGLVVLLSDGENRGAPESAEKALRLAGKSNVKIVAIGVGGDYPSRIPIYENGKLIGFEKDSKGNEFVTRLDEDTLRLIARESGGVYVHEEEIDEARAFIEKALVLEKVKIEGAANPIIVYMLMAAFVPLAILKKYSVA
ncbi:MAG: VWA domain-containing protein [Candidatus Spechtbacteria bacterium]|nr:VWA domain-containing protein [Candidatus Spechtbacteria bacterium]